MVRCMPVRDRKHTMLEAGRQQIPEPLWQGSNILRFQPSGLNAQQQSWPPEHLSPGSPSHLEPAEHAIYRVRQGQVERPKALPWRLPPSLVAAAPPHPAPYVERPLVPQIGTKQQQAE